MKSNLLKIIEHLDAFFEGDEDKIMEWLIEKNPHVGMVPPILMCMIGRTDKLLKFIETQKELGE